MDTIPLFPLRSVLFPKARLPLQIFEPRYLDLVKSSLKTNTGFGVVWLRKGHEVNNVHANITQLAEVGTYARIVDWQMLDNGLLGVVIEGEKKFSLHAYEQSQTNLWTGSVEWIVPEPLIPLPDDATELTALLSQLARHPHVTNLALNCEVSDVESLGCVLSQLLPIDETVKFSLLLMDSLTRLEQLMDILAAME